MSSRHRSSASTLLLLLSPVSRSFGPPPTEQPSERNVDVLLTHLDREGHDVSRRPLAFAGMSPPRFAASASGDAVLISAVVDTAAQQKSLFPDAPFVPASAGRNILIGRLMVE